MLVCQYVARQAVVYVYQVYPVITLKLDVQGPVLESTPPTVVQ